MCLFSSIKASSGWPARLEVISCGVEFKVGAMAAHVVDDGLAHFWVLSGVGKELVREGSEETIAYTIKRSGIGDKGCT